MRRCRAHLAGRLLLVVILSAVLAVPVPAIAALEDDPKATSSTNPDWPEGANVWWRDGWGNDPYPDLVFGTIPKDATTDGRSVETLGFLYWITRESTVDTASVPPVNVSISPVGAISEHTFDLAGILADPGLGPWDPDELEGAWYVHVAFYNRYRLSGDYYTYFLGYDARSPGAVSNLVASTSVSGTSNTDTWTETSRRYVTWDDAIDLLSGIGVYEYKLNDKFVAYHPALFTPYQMLTVESLPAGKNKITITPLDRAANAGPSKSVYAYVDPDVPTIKLTAPTSSVVNAGPTIKATASDKAGIRSVKFYVNDKLVYTDTTSPYQYKASLGGYSQGSWVNLKAVAQDMYGHKATATKSSKLDKVAPTIKNVSDTPDPFYPVLQDKYKDKNKIKFKLSEKSKMYLKIYTKKGTLIRTITCTRGKGNCSISWNGKNKDGEVKTGTFYYKLIAKDAAGNKKTTKKYPTTIRDYEIVRVSGNAVKVVPR